MSLIKEFDGHHVFYCSGCERLHKVDGKWSINFDELTITPSVLTYYEIDGEHITECHLFVTKGKIQYLQDCKHKLAGKTVDMVELDDN